MSDVRTENEGIDLNRFIPAYLAADGEQRQRAMAILIGADPTEEAELGARAPERLLNQIEIARVLGVHPTTVRRWAIPCHRLGRVPRYRIDEVMAYIRSPKFRRRVNALKQKRDK